LPAVPDTGHASGVLVRKAMLSDLPELIDVQQSGGVPALAHIFPQDTYPLPRD
jgi:hypothetical protein